MPTLPNFKIERSRRRSIALQIERDGTLIVRAPHFVPVRQIEIFLSEHLDWVEKHLTTISRTKQARAKNEYFYLGRKLMLTPSDVTGIAVRGDKLLFPHGLLFRQDKELVSWYIKEAEKVITLQTKKYAKEMKTDFKEITFSDTKSQWGRCTSDNRLQFSWRLIMAPLMTLNYVVIHELAHTIEKNHSQLFWMKVRNFNPSYRQQIKWLRDNGPSLTI